MADHRLEFQYSAREVTSAQRTRFFRGIQFKLILVIWVLSVLITAAPLIFPQAFPDNGTTSWSMVLLLSLAYFITLIVMLVVTPWLEFHFNRVWKVPVTFQYNEKQVRLLATGKTGGLHLKWSEIRQIDEIAPAYLIYYGSEGKFILLPKSAFSNQAEEQGFRELAVQSIENPGKASTKES